MRGLDFEFGTLWVSLASSHMLATHMMHKKWEIRRFPYDEPSPVTRRPSHSFFFAYLNTPLVI